MPIRLLPVLDLKGPSFLAKIPSGLSRLLKEILFEIITSNRRKKYMLNSDSVGASHVDADVDFLYDAFPSGEWCCVPHFLYSIVVRSMISKFCQYYLLI